MTAINSTDEANNPVVVKSPHGPVQGLVPGTNLTPSELAMNNVLNDGTKVPEPTPANPPADQPASPASAHLMGGVSENVFVIGIAKGSERKQSYEAGDLLQAVSYSDLQEAYNDLETLRTRLLNAMLQLAYNQGAYAALNQTSSDETPAAVQDADNQPVTSEPSSSEPSQG